MPDKGLMLNVGSGQRPFDKPWINVDCQSRWNPDVCIRGEDIVKHFGSMSADVIVLHHVLEHYGCGEAKDLLNACHEALTPDGKLLVFVPDMNALARMWQMGRLTTQVYMTNLYGAYMGDEADRHKWGYTRESLRLLLMGCGFSLVVPAGHLGSVPDGADIAIDDWIIYTEAWK